MTDNDGSRIIYNRDEVLKASIEYFNGDELAAKVWINKYSLKDSDGNLYEKSPVDMHHRIANEIARIESKYSNPISGDEIFNLLDRFKYIIPGGSPMSGIGNNIQAVSLSNCFVIGEEGNSDSYGSILKTDQEQVQLMKRRGGVGHTLEAIRPAGSPVKNSALTSTGMVPFMERYSNSTREVAQDGRRGALMLSCFHKNTFILTDIGWITIINVISRIKNGENIKAWTHEGFKDIIDTQIIEDRELYEIETENGKKIMVTSDHEFSVKNVKTGEEYLKALKDIDVEKEELILYID
jgi:ribonucleotide reductase alpha subunit